MIFLILSVTSFSISFFRQKDAKMDPTSDQNENTNHPETRFLRFWSVLGGIVFSTFLGTGKSRPQIRKHPEKKQRGGNGPAKWVGLAECAGPAER
jgi:hypothetical protein